MKSDWQKAAKVLKNDGVVILPTDTLYGLVGSVFSKKSISKIYKIKGRSNNKPLLILITSYSDLALFGISLDKEQLKFLSKIWPGKVSIELLHSLKKFSLIRAGHNYSGFRMIGKKNIDLFNLIRKIGPIVAPSANKQGIEPAYTITEAKNYFGDSVDLYISVGKRKSSPSTLVRLENNRIEILRQGTVRINIK